jgi:SAM-dependent methyltransferase
MYENQLRAISPEVIGAAAVLGEGRVASLARVVAVLSLYHGMERVFAAGGDPVAGCEGLLRELRGYFHFTAGQGFAPTGGTRVEPAEVDEVVAQVTGEHYGELFGDFSAATYWEEPRQLLSERLERNGIAWRGLAGRRLLDAGCGGGRYSVAWWLLGAKRVTGVDISPRNIATARRRVEEAAISGVEFVEGDVLALPFPDEEFDGVFSNGVLHHTTDWRRGVAELVRVLKPGGWGWLYLIEAPGGLHWEMIEIMRAIMAREDRRFARELLRLLKIPENRIFYMLDHVMAPINQRLTPAEVEEALAASGARGIARLSRGADFDRIEQLYRGAPYAAEKYGVGENRYVFSR